jgi:uncharacterized protein with FMN-binding domain
MPFRAAITLAATAIGVVLLFSFRTPPAAPIATLTPSSISSSSSTPSPTATPSGAPPSGGGSPTPAATTTATPTPKPTASGLKSGSFTGQSLANPYGNVQVQVVVSGGKITDVKTIQYPNGHQQSVFINEQALPMLRGEVLQAQSAQINIIGGATFTSESYAQSVQAALDVARA